VAYAFVVEVAACCWAPTEEPVWNALLVAVEAPKLEPCDAFVECPVLAVRAALLLRLALLVRAPVPLEDELPWLAWLELELLADPFPVVAVVAWLFPVLLALFEPVLDGLLYAVSLLVFELPELPLEEEAAFAAAPLEEPLFALLWLELAVRSSEAVRASVAFSDEPPELL
jgi:hypothetical protein